MQVCFERLYGLALEYQAENPKDRWEALFDHMNRVGYARVFTHETQAFHEAFATYLARFGMFRRGLCAEKTTIVLTRCRKPFSEYLLSPSDGTLARAWKACYEWLNGLKCATTPTVITKIIMGLGGRFPALDSRAVGMMCSQPLFMSRGIDSLTAGLSRGRRSLETPAGNRIPWERVLDMALWQGGPEHGDWLQCPSSGRGCVH